MRDLTFFRISAVVNGSVQGSNTLVDPAFVEGESPIVKNFRDIGGVWPRPMRGTPSGRISRNQIEKAREPL